MINELFIRSIKFLFSGLKYRPKNVTSTLNEHNFSYKLVGGLKLQLEVVTNYRNRL